MNEINIYVRFDVRKKSNLFCCVSGRINRRHFRVVAGLHVMSAPGDQTQIRSISEVKMHKDYNGITPDNDVTLLLLSSPFNLTDHVQPVCTPHNVTHEFFLNFSHCFITGWGSTYFRGWFKNSLILQRCYDDDPDPD